MVRFATGSGRDLGLAGRLTGGRRVAGGLRALGAAVAASLIVKNELSQRNQAMKEGLGVRLWDCTTAKHSGGMVLGRRP